MIYDAEIIGGREELEWEMEAQKTSEQQLGGFPNDYLCKTRDRKEAKL